jgi:hypothetical protein
MQDSGTRHLARTKPQQLGISAATVKNHVHHLLEKLAVHRRAQASAILSGITPR